MKNINLHMVCRAINKHIEDKCDRQDRYKLDYCLHSREGCENTFKNIHSINGSIDEWICTYEEFLKLGGDIDKLPNNILWIDYQKEYSKENDFIFIKDIYTKNIFKLCSKKDVISKGVDFYANESVYFIQHLLKFGCIPLKNK